LDYYFGFKKNFLIYDINSVKNVTQLKDSYVIFGGSRGWDMIIGDNIYSEFALKLIKQPPKDWILMKTIYGKIIVNRKWNLMIYYVPM
jgi:hypothetical protein